MRVPHTPSDAASCSVNHKTICNRVEHLRIASSIHRTCLRCRFPTASNGMMSVMFAQEVPLGVRFEKVELFLISAVV